MIGYLEGTIKFKNNNSIIILTNGIGFKVTVSPEILTKAELNKPIHLYTYTHVTEDALALFGFASPEDLALFELLLTVSGIGPKTALAIFSAGKPDKIKDAIIRGDVAFFTSVPRVGTKNAQKIIIELRSKLGSLGVLDLTAESPESKEIVEALKSFGFTSGEAKEALKITNSVEGSVSDKIRAALKAMGKR